MELPVSLLSVRQFQFGEGVRRQMKPPTHRAHTTTAAVFQASEAAPSQCLPSLLPAPGRSACRVRFPAQEAFPAVHRPPLCRLERNRRLTPALGATGHRFGFSVSAARSLPLGLAWLAALRFVLEVFVVEEVLFSRCEYKFCSAIYALEGAILKLRHIHLAP